MNDTEKVYQITPYMDVYKAHTQYSRSLDKLKLIIVVGRYCQNKYMFGDTWYLTSSLRDQNYLVSDASNNKSRVHQLDFIGEFIQANVKYRVVVNL